MLNLNRDYIEAVERSDVGWYRQILTDDFRCSLPDADPCRPRAIPRPGGGPARHLYLEAHDIEIRVMRDAAIVRGRTTFSSADGRPASGQCAEMWCRHDGQWFVAAAHFTRRVD